MHAMHHAYLYVLRACICLFSWFLMSMNLVVFVSFSSFSSFFSFCCRDRHVLRERMAPWDKVVPWLRRARFDFIMLCHCFQWSTFSSMCWYTILRFCVNKRLSFIVLFVCVWSTIFFSWFVVYLLCYVTYFPIFLLGYNFFLRFVTRVCCSKLGLIFTCALWFPSRVHGGLGLLSYLCRFIDLVWCFLFLINFTSGWEWGVGVCHWWIFLVLLVCILRSEIFCVMLWLRMFVCLFLVYMLRL